MSLPHRLLLVDDEEAILFAMGDFLVRSGYEVDRARSREEAERLLAVAQPYSLAIVDLRLGATEPRGGLDLLRRIRESSPQTQTILLTAYGSPDVEAELAAIGADRLLSKPQPLARLAEEVSALLGRRAAGST
ncbi:MAG TPA: response regulator [Thermoanaerobaculia bacterium]|jgi:DNA-binding response OmpR family regulator|nr:response regulator [Thermoanaerobaculia bacterium]